MENIFQNESLNDSLNSLDFDIYHLPEETSELKRIIKTLYKEYIETHDNLEKATKYGKEMLKELNGFDLMV